MGKSLPATATTLRELARLLSSSPERLQRSRPRHTKQPPVVRALSAAKTRQSGGVRVDSDPVKKTKMGHNILEGRERVPLAEVVSDCVHRWFQDTLREAKNGDRAMEVLVGQMYLSGYGVPRDEKKGRGWISRASQGRSSAWKVSNKPPGYAASDSDSEDLKGDAK
ncbi:Sel1-like [Melia azedarach]|uniref:Sel1-like n=1 Tax=Melia azedarach TaxID=155640 RepID=A0ACC1Y8S4_MELAZ|nr:Sel1-like [Melia azedarach]